MDSYENEASKFAAQRTKLKNICEAHDLTYTFIKNSYPIKLIIRPIKGVGEQMSMLETASEDSYISPDAYLLFTMKDGVLVYRMSKTFTIEDALFGKIKNIFKNMHSYCYKVSQNQIDLCDDHCNAFQLCRKEYGE